MKEWLLCLLGLVFTLVVTGEAEVIDARSRQVQIYGVRWFLGEKFRFQQPITVKELNESISHLVLFFNTKTKYPLHTFSASIEQKTYQCNQVQVDVNITERHHVDFNQFASKKGQNHSIFIHKCPVLFQEDKYLERVQEIPYTILANINQNDQQIFTASLRSPSYQMTTTSLTVFGDWGVMSNYSKQSRLSSPITPCLMEQIQSDPQIKLMLLLGDLAYDLQGRSYINFFTYLQAFSSKVAILFSPGNHETIKHKDIYQLAKQSFYSPFWSHFYGYFDLVQLGQYVFVGYNTEGLFPGLWLQSNSSLFQVELKEYYKEYYNLFSMQLPPEAVAKLKQKKVIGYSHYPTYCSQQDHHESCIDYRTKHQPFLQKLSEIGMRMFVSGHLHIYERSKQICNMGKTIRSGKIEQGYYEYAYEENCSIFVVEGAAGNNYYVQTQRHFQLRPHSEKFVNNTGYGLLTLKQQNNSTHFRHIIADGCRAVDEVVLWDSSFAKKVNLQKFYGVNARYLIIIGGSLFLLVIVFIRIYQQRKHLRHNGEQLSSKSSTNVLQMAQHDDLCHP